MVVKNHLHPLMFNDPCRAQVILVIKIENFMLISKMLTRLSDKTFPRFCIKKPFLISNSFWKHFVTETCLHS
jgi:hypothetical protein